MTTISIKDCSVRPPKQYQFTINRIKSCEFPTNVNTVIPQGVQQDINKTLNQDRVHPFEMSDIVLTSIGLPDNNDKYITQLVFTKYV